MKSKNNFELNIPVNHSEEENPENISPIVCASNRLKNNVHARKNNLKNPDPKHSVFKEDKCRRQLFHDLSSNELVDIRQSNEENNENCIPRFSSKKDLPKSTKIDVVD